MYGSLIASDLDLYLPESNAPAGSQMTLRRSDHRLDPEWIPESIDVVVDFRMEDRGIHYLAARTNFGFRLRFSDVCEFDLNRDLSQVIWRTAPGCDDGLVSVLAVGALMAFRLMLAGHLVLHCSAVLVGKRGLAFVGSSGMGKSTMATLLCATGASLIADDIGRVDILDGGALIWPGSVESRLRPAAARLEEMFDDSAVSRPTIDGRSALRLPSMSGEPASLDAVVVPVPSRGHHEPEMEILSGGQALLTLSRFPRVLGLVDRELQERQFNLLADLVERVPVYVARVPWGPPFMAETGDRLLEQLGWLDSAE